MTKTPHLITALLALGLLSGCAVGPNFKAPKPDLPQTWLATPTHASFEAASDEAWWKGFNDAELAVLIARSDSANLDARQAILRVEEARDARRVALAGAYPSLNAGASYQSSRISERTSMASLLGALAGSAPGGAPGGVSSLLSGFKNPFDQYQYGLSASWEADVFGRIRRTVEAATAQVKAAEDEQASVRLAVRAEVAAAYVDLRDAQRKRHLAAQNIRTGERLMQLVEKSRAAGLSNDIDLASAKGQLAGLKATLPGLEARIRTDENQLTLLIAAAPGSLDDELGARAAPPLAPARIAVGLPSDLARRRPDIRRAEDALHAAVAMQGVATASLYPTFALNAGLGYEASKPSDLTDWAAHYLTVGPSLSLPLFDAGQRRATVKLEGARAKEAAVAYAQTVLVGLHEAETALSAVAREQERLDALRAVVEQDRRALDLEGRRYAIGSNSYRDVLLAQEKLQLAELDEADSLAAHDIDVITLYRALGGGWTDVRAQ